MARTPKADPKIETVRRRLARRNLWSWARTQLARKLRPLWAARAKERQGTRTDLSPSLGKSPIDTERELAAVANVSHDTIARGEVIANRADDNAKGRLWRGETSINTVHTDINREDRRAGRTASDRGGGDDQERSEQTVNPESPPRPPAVRGSYERMMCAPNLRSRVASLCRRQGRARRGGRPGGVLDLFDFLAFQDAHVRAVSKGCAP